MSSFMRIGGGGRNKSGRRRRALRVSGQIALRKTPPSPPPFYFPEISRLDVIRRGEPAGQKDDRSDRRRARNSRASVLRIASGRTHARTIALSLIFSD